MSVAVATSLTGARAGPPGQGPPRPAAAIVSSHDWYVKVSEGGSITEGIEEPGEISVRSLLLKDCIVVLGVMFLLVFGLAGSALIWYGNASGPSGEAIVLSSAEKTQLTLAVVGVFSVILAAVVIIQWRAYTDLVTHGRVLRAEEVDFEKRGRTFRMAVFFTLDGNDIIARRLFRGHIVWRTKGLGAGAHIKVLVHEAKPDRFVIVGRS